MSNNGLFGETYAVPGIRRGVHALGVTKYDFSRSYSTKRPDTTHVNILVRGFASSFKTRLMLLPDSLDITLHTYDKGTHWPYTCRGVYCILC